MHCESIKDGSHSLLVIVWISMTPGKIEVLADVVLFLIFLILNPSQQDIWSSFASEGREGRWGNAFVSKAQMLWARVKIEHVTNWLHRSGLWKQQDTRLCALRRTHKPECACGTACNTGLSHLSNFLIMESGAEGAEIPRKGNDVISWCSESWQTGKNISQGARVACLWDLWVLASLAVENEKPHVSSADESLKSPTCSLWLCLIVYKINSSYIISPQLQHNKRCKPKCLFQNI